MAQAPITFPTVYQTDEPAFQQIAAYTESTSTAFVGQQFVTTTGTPPLLTKVADSGTTATGLSLDAAHGTAAEPYTAPFGTSHNVHTLRATNFVMNVCGAGKAVGTGTTSAVAIGAQFGLATFGTTGYTNVQCVNVADTTNKALQIDGYFPGDNTNDLNPRVIVKWIGSITATN